MQIELSLEQIQYILKAMRWQRDRLKNNTDEESKDKVERLDKAITNLEVQLKKYIQ